MLTYQDFEKAVAGGNVRDFIIAAIGAHRTSEAFRTALDADAYDRQRNVTISRYTDILQQSTHNPLVNITAANNRIKSNFFHRLNTQRCSYSLGNGVSFTQKEQRVDAEGVTVTVDATKERLGAQFDTALYDWGYKALIHGVAFGFWNVDRLHVFPLTQFVPLWDEDYGTLRAGIHFWRVAPDKPMTATLYTEQGYTVYRSPRYATGSAALVEAEPLRDYVLDYVKTKADGLVVTGAQNYASLPIVPLWGSKLKQSTLVGLREKIDSFDLIQSGFANDLRDCARIYWIIQNCGGMTDKDMADFLERLRVDHIANVDSASFTGDVKNALTPYVQDVPYSASSAFLTEMRNSIYEDFGALDVHAIAATSTNDHIDAAYQPMDEEADDFEYQVIEAVQQLLRLIGIEDTPQFKRNRVSNVKETIEAVMMLANYLDTETVLQLAPIISVDMIPGILARLDIENAGRLTDDEGDGEGGDAGGGDGGAEV